MIFKLFQNPVLIDEMEEWIGSSSMSKVENQEIISQIVEISEVCDQNGKL